MRIFGYGPASIVIGVVYSFLYGIVSRLPMIYAMVYMLYTLELDGMLAATIFAGYCIGRLLGAIGTAALFGMPVMAFGTLSGVVAHAGLLIWPDSQVVFGTMVCLSGFTETVTGVDTLLKIEALIEDMQTDEEQLLFRLHFIAVTAGAIGAFLGGGILFERQGMEGIAWAGLIVSSVQCLTLLQYACHRRLFALHLFVSPDDVLAMCLQAEAEDLHSMRLQELDGVVPSMSVPEVCVAPCISEESKSQRRGSFSSSSRESKSSTASVLSEGRRHQYIVLRSKSQESGSLHEVPGHKHQQHHHHAHSLLEVLADPVHLAAAAHGKAGHAQHPGSHGQQEASDEEQGHGAAKAHHGESQKKRSQKPDVSKKDSHKEASHKDASNKGASHKDKAASQKEASQKEASQKEGSQKKDSQKKDSQKEGTQPRALAPPLQLDSPRSDEGAKVAKSSSAVSAASRPVDPTASCASRLSREGSQAPSSTGSLEVPGVRSNMRRNSRESKNSLVVPSGGNGEADDEPPSPSPSIGSRASSCRELPNFKELDKKQQRWTTISMWSIVLSYFVTACPIGLNFATLGIFWKEAWDKGTTFSGTLMSMGEVLGVLMLGPLASRKVFESRLTQPFKKPMNLVLTTWGASVCVLLVTPESLPVSAIFSVAIHVLNVLLHTFCNETAAAWAPRDVYAKWVGRCYIAKRASNTTMAFVCTALFVHGGPRVPYWVVGGTVFFWSIGLLALYYKLRLLPHQTSDIHAMEREGEGPVSLKTAFEIDD